jgi:cellulose synthase/poly-beta-1,6-N-acetylglucosamine synthase-like glycosyltransferase
MSSAASLVWRALRLDRETTHSRASTSTTPTLSVIVPTLNEERNVARAIRSTGDGPLEVIVVDGGSSDRTVEFARACGATVRPT